MIKPKMTSDPSSVSLRVHSYTFCRSVRKTKCASNICSSTRWVCWRTSAC